MNPFFFSTGSPDGLLAAASRPSSAGKFEIETADDFVLTSPTTISSATFTGLLTGGSTTSDVGGITIEIYRVFPQDSNASRTSGPPTFSTSQVPTRVNSPSDVALVSSSSGSGLTFQPPSHDRCVQDRLECPPLALDMRTNSVRRNKTGRYIRAGSSPLQARREPATPLCHGGA